jgi:hypothetical protein
MPILIPAPVLPVAAVNAGALMIAGLLFKAIVYRMLG